MDETTVSLVNVLENSIGEDLDFVGESPIASASDEEAEELLAQCQTQVASSAWTFGFPTDTVLLDESADPTWAGYDRNNITSNVLPLLLYYPSPSYALCAQK
jgi:hypothetical protein